MCLKLYSPRRTESLLELAAGLVRDVLGPDESPATVTIKVHSDGSFTVGVRTDAGAVIAIGPDDRA